VTRPRRNGTVALILLASLPALAVSAGEPERVPFRLLTGGAIVVPVFVNGKGPLAFLLDTGASGSAILETQARELALPPVAQTTVVTAVGRHSRLVVRLGRVSLGTAEAADVLASVVPAARLDHAGIAIQGVLGQDFLSRFDYTLDYRGRCIRWASPAAGKQVRLKLRRSEGRFLVELPQGGDRVLSFVPDTGANTLVVFDRPGAWVLPAEGLPGNYELSDSSGRREVETRRILALRIGGWTLRNQIAAAIDRPASAASEGDGLLPLHSFASVTFENREGFLVIRAR